MPLKEATWLPGMTVGNDPHITQLEPFAIKDGKIVLIGVSMLRNFLLACQLGNQKEIPKIFIIDNSINVSFFLRLLQDFFDQHKTEKSFMENLEYFLNEHSDLIVNGIEPDPNLYPSTDEREFFKMLFEKYSYDYVRKVVMHATIVNQSWTDEESFRKIGNYIKLHGIKHVFTYISNICHTTEKDIILKVLKNNGFNIPNLTIVTDFNHQKNYPMQKFLVTDSKLDNILKTIFPERKPIHPLQRFTTFKKVDYAFYDRKADESIKGLYQAMKDDKSRQEVIDTFVLQKLIFPIVPKKNKFKK